MASLFDELTAKVNKDPRLTKKSVARFDFTMLLYNARDALRDLWVAADAELARAKAEGRPIDALGAAVEKLRPIFGERVTSATASGPSKRTTKGD